MGHGEAEGGTATGRQLRRGPRKLGEDLAASEFDRCIARKGEATAVFLDDLPSHRLMRPIDGLLKQARSGLAR